MPIVPKGSWPETAIAAGKTVEPSAAPPLAVKPTVPVQVSTKRPPVVRKLTS